jgi:hypothetical protein
MLNDILQTGRDYKKKTSEGVKETIDNFRMI